MWLLGRRRTDPDLAKAQEASAKSLARARADHARAVAGLEHDQRLAASLREMREQNHFSDLLFEAITGRGAKEA